MGDIIESIGKITDGSKLQVITSENPHGWDWTHLLADKYNGPAKDYVWNKCFPYDIEEVGEYSMLVKGNCPGYKIASIRGIEIKESIETPEGTLLYFESKLPDELKYYSVVYAIVESDWKSEFTWEVINTMARSGIAKADICSHE